MTRKKGQIGWVCRNCKGRNCYEVFLQRSSHVMWNNCSGGKFVPLYRLPKKAFPKEGE